MGTSPGLLLALTLATELARAAPFTNGGFEVPVVADRQHVAIPPWDLSEAPTCHLYPYAYIGLAPIEGKQHLAISHADGALGEAISQTFETSVGTRYVIRFSAGWTGNPSSRDMQVLTTVKSGTGELLASTNVHLPAKATWGTTAISFVAKTPSATLTFKDNSSIAFQTAIFLDDISVVGTAPAEPCKTMVGGTVANQLWTKEESPYCVTNDVYVSGLLRIKEGVEVRFEGNHVFEVGGRIRADGTEEQPIRFRPADNTVGWQGLLFRDAVPGSYFVHTIIEGSKNSGVRITNTPPAFTNCVIRNNTSPVPGGGIRAIIGTPSDLSLLNCTISGNSAPHGGGIYAAMNPTGKLALDWCLVTKNQALGDGGSGGGVSGSGVMILKNTEVSENKAYDGGGINVGPPSVVRMSNSKLLNNQATRAGGGFFLYREAQGESINCLITGNQPEGIQVWNSEGVLKLTNSIVFFNGGSQISGSGSPYAVVAYSDIQGKVWTGPGNISLTPSLCPGTFSLLAGSPCIDAGHPGLEFRDGCRSDEPCNEYARGGPRNDMGAYGGPGVCYWTQPRAEPVIRIAPDNEIGFVGQPVTIGVIATGAEPLVYQWFKNGSPVAGQTNTVMTIPNAALADAAAYYVKVTNPLGEATSPAAPDWPPLQLGIAQLEAQTDGFAGDRPRLLIRNGKAGAKCAIYSVSQLPFGDTMTVPGTPPDGWELRDTLTFTASEVGWTDPTGLGAGETRYYGVLPAP